MKGKVSNIQLGSEVPVRMHLWYGVCAGLFRPLPRASAPRPALDVTHQLSVDELSGKRLTLRLEAREALGAGEQTTLFALLLIAYRRYRVKAGFAWLDADAPDEMGQELWHGLQPMIGDATTQQPMRFTTTWAEICRESGVSGGGSEIQVRQEHLRRLCNVQVWEFVESQNAPRRQSRLLSWILGNDERVHLAINHRLVQALLGTPYCSVLMSERLALQGDTARVLHASLSALVRPGSSTKAHIETLCRRVWPDWDSSINKATRRRRKADLEQALDDIAALPGWRISSQAGAPLLIGRKRIEASDRETTVGSRFTRHRTSSDDEPTSQVGCSGGESQSACGRGLFIPSA